MPAKRLAVGQVLHELQHHGQRKPTRRFCRLTTAWKQRHELAVLIHGAKRFGDAQAERALGEGSTGNAAGLFRHNRRVLRAQHGESFREDRSTSPSLHRSTHRQNAGSGPADFATSISVGSTPSGPVEDDMDENARIAELEQAGAVTDKPNSRWLARACGSGQPHRDRPGAADTPALRGSPDWARSPARPSRQNWDAVQECPPVRVG